jgi:hypothetical protein
MSDKTGKLMVVPTNVQRLIVKPWLLPLTVPVVVIASFLEYMWSIWQFQWALRRK